MRNQYLRLLDIDPKQKVPMDLPNATYNWPSLRCNQMIRTVEWHMGVWGNRKVLETYWRAYDVSTQIAHRLSVL